MQFTSLALLLATAVLTIANPVPAATGLDTRDAIPDGVTFVATEAISAGTDKPVVKRGTPTDSCIATCYSGYSSGMCFWNCWDGQKCGYSVGTCQDTRWNE